MAAGGLILALQGPPAAAGPPYLDEAQIREMIIGQTLDGHYATGLAWTETYAGDGALDYREPQRRSVGRWSFRAGGVFCTFYDPAAGMAMTGGCWHVLKTSGNCFEFYLAGDTAPAEPSEEAVPGALRWNARGSRRSEPSTCSERPAV